MLFQNEESLRGIVLKVILGLNGIKPLLHPSQYDFRNIYGPSCTFSKDTGSYKVETKVTDTNWGHCCSWSMLKPLSRCCQNVMCILYPCGQTTWVTKLSILHMQWPISHHDIYQLAIVLNCLARAALYMHYAILYMQQWCCKPSVALIVVLSVLLYLFVRVHVENH